MPFELPKLPYEPDALQPYISRQTIEFHYGKHHLAYVNNLNSLIIGTPFEKTTLEDIVRKAGNGIFNNGAQVWNHNFYFLSFSPEGEREPSGDLLKAIIKQYGSFAGFKEQFTKAAVTIFGSGWAWLVKKENGTLDIVQESNAGNPLRNGLTPLMTCDVWEHAYYLDYQNKRADYIQAFWNVLNWKVIADRY